MIPEAPFLFAIVALSASLAGLAGLVAGLRRGADMRPIDGFRLREIVEFAFSNILLCASVIPLTQLLPGGLQDAVRVAALFALVYVLGTTFVLLRRMRREGIAWTPGWRVSAGVLVAAIAIGSIAVMLSGSIIAFEALLVFLLARPMLVFVLVLGSFEGST